MNFSKDEDEDESITPRCSPLLLTCESNDVSNHNCRSADETTVTECLECNLSSRRYAITCENDLYHRKSLHCQHDKQQVTRSSSAFTFLEHNRHDSNETIYYSPPKFTNTLNSDRQKVIRPIPYKPLASRCRAYEGPANNALERYGSETTVGNSNSIIDINTQRFGGSLSNVLPSSDLHLRREVSESVPHIGSTTSEPQPLSQKGFFSNRLWYGSKKKLDLVRRSTKVNENSPGRAQNEAHPNETAKLTLLRSSLKSIQIEDKLDNEKTQTSLLRQELNCLRDQLQDANWIPCHRSGETTLIRARLKDSQGDHNVRNSELIHLRQLVKDLSTEITTLRGQLSQTVLSFRSKEKENVILKQRLTQEHKLCKDKLEESTTLRTKLNELEIKYSSDQAKWERERRKWIEEQKRVLRYQKALQHNYLLTCQKAQSLAAQVESFSSVSV